MVFTNVYMTVLYLSWITFRHSAKHFFIFSAGAGTLIKILLIEWALSFGHNFASYTLFRGIFFSILEFRYHRHSLTMTVQWENEAVNIGKPIGKPSCQSRDLFPLVLNRTTANALKSRDFRPLFLFLGKSGNHKVTICTPRWVNCNSPSHISESDTCPPYLEMKAIIKI